MIRGKALRLLCCLAILGLAAGCGGGQAASSESWTSPGLSTELPALTSTEAVASTQELMTVPTIPETEAPSSLPTESVPETAPVPETSPSQPELSPEELLARMSPEERTAQLFLVTPEALTGVQGAVTVARETTRNAFDRIPVGGVIYMGQNLQSPEQVKALLSGMQQISLDRLGLPIFLSVDEEGGTVARISGNPAFGQQPIADMARIGDSGDTALALETGRTIGRYLRELGFNLDFAPCADVLTNPDNRVVQRRSFGSDPDRVIAMAGALAQGLQEQGVLPCYKHFPGHGGTAEDSHLGFALLHMDLESLKTSQELKPFLDAAARDIPMIMTGHITIEGGDGLPASLSPTLIGLLRGPELNYQGLLITDALSMGAITERFSPGEAAVKAIQAGNDLLLVPEHLEEAYNAVLEAVQNGTLSQERIDESVLRILTTKLELLP